MDHHNSLRHTHAIHWKRRAAHHALRWQTSAFVVIVIDPPRGRRRPGRSLITPRLIVSAMSLIMVSSSGSVTCNNGVA